MAIPDRVPGTVTIVSSDTDGNIPTTLVWDHALPGKYDIVVDVDDDGLYYPDQDPLDDDEIEVTVGFFVVPEYPLGTILGLSMCLAALAVFKSKSLRIHL